MKREVGLGEIFGSMKTKILMPWTFSAAFFGGWVLSLGLSILVFLMEAFQPLGMSRSAVRVIEKMLGGVLSIVLYLTIIFAILAIVLSLVYLMRRQFHESGIAALSIIGALSLVIMTFPLAGPVFMAAGLSLERLDESDETSLELPSFSRPMDYFLNNHMDE